MINLTVTDIFTTEFYAIKPDMAILHLFVLQKMDPILNNFLNPPQNVPFHGHSQLKHQKLGSGQLYGVGAWMVPHCPHVTLISGPTFNPLCTQKFSMVDGGPQNSQNWGVGPYLGQDSRYKHVMFTRTRQMGNFSFLLLVHARNQNHDPYVADLRCQCSDCIRWG